jgi:hypothetical protein
LKDSATGWPVFKYQSATVLLNDGAANAETNTETFFFCGYKVLEKLVANFGGYAGSSITNLDQNHIC